MTQMKQVVSLFCELLQYMGIGHLQPETFRCAKFNKPTSEAPLLSSIRKLIEMNQSRSRELPDHDSREEEIAFVLKEMSQRGYRKGKLSGYDSHVHKSESVCSRDLLLAFAWLFEQTSIFNRFSSYVHHCIICIARGLPSSSMLGQMEDTLRHHLAWWTWMKEQGISSGQGVLRKSAKQTGEVSDKRLPYLVQQVLSARNRVAMSMKALYAVESGFSKLSSKAHVATQRPGSKSDQSQHLSLNEVYLLRHPDLLKKSVQLLGKLTERLEKLTMWADQGPLFWQWMESVIDAQQAEQNSSRTLFTRAPSDCYCPVDTVSSPCDLPVRWSPLWCMHLQWVGSETKKPSAGTLAGVQHKDVAFALKCKIDEANSEIFQLESHVKELQERCLLDVERLKSTFPRISFDTSDLTLCSK